VPVRKRPVIKSVSTGQQKLLGLHLEPFLHYLSAECGLSDNTVLAYRNDLSQFIPWYMEHGSNRLEEVDLKLLTQYLQHLHQRRLSATTVARQLVSLKMFFRYLVLEGLILESKADLLNSPKLWQHLPKVLSPEKVDQLLTAPAREDRYPLRDRALLSVLYATGCRASELVSLRLRDVQLEQRYCRCRGKGNKERVVTLNPRAVAAIEAYLDGERKALCKGQEPEWLFLTRSGNALSRVMVWNLIKKYAARIGCSSEISPHTLRHSFATHMLAGGADIRALQELLGHASIRTTQIYTHVEHSRLKSVHSQCHPRG